MKRMRKCKGGAMAGRDALKTLAAAGDALPLDCDVDLGGAQPLARFLTVAERDGRWWFITPDGWRFWSVGMNHIDSAALRLAGSGDTGGSRPPRVEGGTPGALDHRRGLLPTT